MDFFIYPTGKRLLASDVVKLGLRAMLVTAAYAPKIGHLTITDVTHEANGQGYTAGGQSLQNLHQVEEDGELVLHADPAVWADSKIRAHGVVLYCPRSGNRLLCYQSLGEEHRSSNREFEVSWPDGILAF